MPAPAFARAGCGGHPVPMALVSWMPACAGMTRGHKHWQYIYERDSSATIAHWTLITTLVCKEVEHGWTRGQSGPDYRRWWYERHWPGHGAQTGSAGRGHGLDR